MRYLDFQHGKAWGISTLSRMRKAKKPRRGERPFVYVSLDFATLEAGGELLRDLARGPSHRKLRAGVRRRHQLGLVIRAEEGANGGQGCVSGNEK